jgi:hypothetical protein
LLWINSYTGNTRRGREVVLREHADVVNETGHPRTVGGYRVGRQLAQGRFLGHALAPSLVELVFLDELPQEQQRIVCSAAQDFSSLSDGGRVAIVARTTNNAVEPDHDKPLHIGLTTPPELVESWRHMEVATAAASNPPNPVPDENNSLLARVTGLVKRAKRGPLVLAVIASVVAVVAVVALVPATPSNTVSAGVSNPFSHDPVGSLSFPTQTPSASERSTSIEPLAPLSSLGDFILVRVPARSGQGPGDIAVLERSADSWIVRETYPEASGAP